MVPSLATVTFYHIILPHPHSHHTYPNVVSIMSVFFHKQGDTKTSQVKNIGRDHGFNDTAIGSQNSEAKYMYQFVMKWHHIYFYFFHSLQLSHLSRSLHLCQELTIITVLSAFTVPSVVTVLSILCTCAKNMTVIAVTKERNLVENEKQCINL